MRQIHLRAAIVSKICRNSDAQTLSRPRVRGERGRQDSPSPTHAQKKSSDQSSDDFVLGFCFVWPFCLASMYLPSLSCLLFCRISAGLEHQVLSFIRVVNIQPDKSHPEKEFSFFRYLWCTTGNWGYRGNLVTVGQSLASCLAARNSSNILWALQGPGISLALGWFLWPL